MALSALCSCQNATPALDQQHQKNDGEIDQSRARPDNKAAASIIHGIGPYRYDNNLRRALGCFRQWRWDPNSAAAAASELLRPCCSDRTAFCM